MAKRKPRKPRRAPTRAEPPRLNPAALSIDDIAALLTRAGSREISAAQVRRDLGAGAPQNADGSIHLVHYAAWLASQAD